MALIQIYLLIALYFQTAWSHDHHTEHIASEEYISRAPIDWILWLHFSIQTAAWMVAFPLGMILGVVRSRWHVPLQTGGVVLAIIGYFLGHVHGGREFRHNFHGQFANLLTIWLAIQVACGIYLKLHLQHKLWIHTRLVVLATHAVLGIGMPAISWMQVVIGGFTAVGFCHGNAATQCVVRTVAGSTTIGVGLSVLAILEDERSKGDSPSNSLRRSSSIMIMVSSNALWIIDWVYEDLTSRVFLDVLSLGLIWVFAITFVVCFAFGHGGTGVTLVPGILVVVNGWYIAATPTNNAAAVLYGSLGFSMQGIGLGYLVLQCTKLLLNETSNTKILRRFATISTSYLLCACGILFLGTNNEQIQLLSTYQMSATTLVLLLNSATALLYGSAVLSLRILCQARSTVTATRDLEGINTSPSKQLFTNDFPYHSSLPPAEHFNLEDIIDED